MKVQEELHGTERLLALAESESERLRHRFRSLAEDDPGSQILLRQLADQAAICAELQDQLAEDEPDQKVD